jgi:predicted amidophosphoribosyltransferase
MAKFIRRKILGKWRDGYCLDLHTLSSMFLGYDEFGHPRFETLRSEIGELLYRLKNKGDMSVVPEIVDAAEVLLAAWKPNVDLIVPVPPSTQRALPPVRIVATEIGKRIGLPVVNCVSRVRDTPQLKNVFGLDERLQLLEGLHAVDVVAAQGKRILLFDDLYRSGATMNAITSELLETGKAAEVFAMTITKTRSNQ